MTITDIMKKRMSLSFEVFPPKADQPIDPLLETLDHLYDLSPDFISCTYGASGSNVGRNVEICKSIQDKGKAIPLTHFTCVNNTKENVKQQLGEYLQHGINHILALRGDLPLGWEGTKGDFRYASDLVGFIRGEFGDAFTIAMAAAPEKHIEANSFEEDIAHLRIKQDAGCDYIMTQLCFDTDHFKWWADKIRRAKIQIPIDVGVMPILNKEATIRMALAMNGCSIPRKLAELISRNYNNPNDFRKYGIEYTIQQINEYMTLGIDGLHIYALNKWKAATEIVDGVGLTKIK